MNAVFDNIPVPVSRDAKEYGCAGGARTLLFENCVKADFDEECSALVEKGFRLFDGYDIKENYYRTYRSDITVCAYYCESENALRLIADPHWEAYETKPSSLPRVCDTTLWQFEVDHSLIDCGMCYIFRLADGGFFIIDGAHMYSVNDDVRIVEFLKARSGGKKPVVEGWFFSHGHEDHISKFLDIVEYRRSEIEIRSVFCNFPPMTCRDASHWGECAKNTIARFERVMAANPDIKRITPRAGNRFYVGDVEFVVLCSHEDVFPNSLANFNDSSVSLMATAGGSRIFFPGDSAAECDKILLRRYGDWLKCDVVQISHHGHFGLSPELYRLARADCALFPVTQIKFDEDYPIREANRAAAELAKEYYIASNGTVEIPLPYRFGRTKVYPDETFEDFNGIYNLWGYEYSEERKAYLYNEFLKRKAK